MADRWMEERDRRWRERDWRRSEDADRPGGYAGEGYYPRGGEGRSFGGGGDEEFAARRSGQDRDRVFGERDTGAGYNRPRPGGGAYGAGGSYGSGEGYRGQYGGSERGTGAHEHGRDWQDPDYAGVSPAMAHGEYELGRGRGGQAARFQSQDYTQGGRYYGDDDRQRIYREEYGQGGRDYGRVPGGYDAGRQDRWEDRSGGGYGGSYGGAGGDYGYRTRPAYGGSASGGTGGYDFERGYGDGGRRDFRSGGGDWGRGRDDDREGGGATDFFYRAGRKVRDWFRGDHLMEGSGGEDRGEDRSYRTDFGRERRYMPDDRGHRGLGPKGYKRSDERISEEVHERLTDDSWLDASGIDVSVSSGEVTLSGTVETREAKHRAERLVEELSGVTHVQNNLRIVASNPLTGSGRGFGDSLAEAQMRKDDPAATGSGGAAGTTPGNGAEDSASTRTTTRRT